MKKIILSSKLISLIFSISVLCFAVVSLTYAAWIAPGDLPPQGDVAVPLNASGTAQAKIGMLMLNCGDGVDCIGSTSGSYAPSGLLVPYGNVGIGVLDPLNINKKLEVRGDMRIMTTYTPLPMIDYPSFPGSASANSVVAFDIIGSADVFRIALNDGNGNLNQYLNGYSDGSNSSKYAITGRSAARFNINGNSFSFWGAPSGNAGNPITWNSVKVGIGRTPAANALEVEGNASKTTASGWSANSDIRIKSDIQNIDNALDIISKLRPVKFKYTDEYRQLHPSIEDKYYYNFIAQEYQEVFPESVQGSGEYLDNKEILSMDSYNAQIVAIKAVQELKEENDSLKARIEALEAKLNIEQ